MLGELAATRGQKRKTLRPLAVTLSQQKQTHGALAETLCF
jgi:hypothetical protein